MRFKDLLGRAPKPDAESSSLGRLITASDEAPRPAVPVSHPAHEAAAAPQPPLAGPLPVADAFAMLLAVEQGDAPPAMASPVPAALTEEQIDRIVTRVAERLAEGPMRDDLHRIVAEVSERLVSDEIQRIRAAAGSTRSSL